MSRLLTALAMCIATPIVLIGSEVEEPSINIGNRLELLVDDALIEKLDGVNFKLHPPRPAEIALQINKPWEGSGNHYLTVFKDDDSYHMYYHSVVGRSNSASGDDWVSYTCYAKSKDGVNWIRPNLGLHELQGSTNNNIVYPGPFGFEDGALLFPYPNQKPDAPPERRYLAPGARVKQKQAGARRFVSFSSHRQTESVGARSATRRSSMDGERRSRAPTTGPRIFWTAIIRCFGSRHRSSTFSTFATNAFSRRTPACRAPRHLEGSRPLVLPGVDAHGSFSTRSVLHVRCPAVLSRTALLPGISHALRSLAKRPATGQV